MRKKEKKYSRFIWRAIGSVVLVIALVALFEIIVIVRDLPHPERIETMRSAQSTKLYDRTGTVLLYEIHGDQNRTVVDVSKLPPYVAQAVIAIEDQGFYNHSAFDFRGVMRALWVNIITGDFSQGGSTITQQLVKNVYLTNEKTIQRKIKEIILSYWLEHQYTKDEILSFYLNQMPYGSSSYGVESASRKYFGISSSSLSVAQAATLAAMLQSPSYYSPWGSHVDELIKRRDYTLLQMKNLGYLTEDEYAAAKAERPVFQPQNIGTIKAPHFSLMVKDQLVQMYGEKAVEEGGFRVITTLDWKLQQTAEMAVKNGVQRNTELYKGTNGALVAQDPKTGEILALVGSADYFNKDIDGNFNVATQGLRQPGSTFKPFVYATAFMKGYTPETVVFDLPTNFNTTGNPLYDYIPQNYDGTYRGPITLKEALAQSVNVPSVKVLYLVGIPSALETARAMGITTLTDPSRYGLSLVLGGGEVKLVDLVEAYSVFAQDGIKHEQHAIIRIEDPNGNEIYTFKDSAQRVLEEQYARAINAILSDVPLRSGLFHSSLSLTEFDGYQVALKTGTTNDYRDAWTVGYTPFLTVGVWAGNSNNAPMQRQGSSILAALPMWNEFMKNIITDYQPEFFPPAPEFTSSVPMVNGQYINIDSNGKKTVHSILYYVDPSNPRIVNQNPGNDPQFYNWEDPVQIWKQQNKL